ncbi:SDR family oxidoreductase [archaeon]|nr:SDR family oxidoreductase [archaeon]
MKIKKVAIITGASKGIGKCLSDIFLKSEYTVINASRNRPSEKTNAIFIKTDVSEKESCRKLIQKVTRKFGRIDVLVNNAGVLHPDTIENLSDKTLKSNFQTNVFGAFFCSYFAAKQMIKQKSGQIINISSSAGVSFREGILSYAASKWSVVGFSGALRLELQKHGVDVICFCPGGTKTQLFRHYKEDVSKDFMDPSELAGKISEAMNRSEKEKWLFVYSRKDRVLKKFGFEDYPVQQ